MHKHHLNPKHLGGTNHPSNLLKVTVEEHALIHEARWYAYHQWQDYVAWQGLIGHIDKETAIRLSSILGGKMSAKKFEKGHKLSPESEEKRRKSLLGNKNAKGSIRTEEQKMSHSAKMKGKSPWNKGIYGYSIGKNDL